jgi:ATP-binding cassette subfamily B protein
VDPVVFVFSNKEWFILQNMKIKRGVKVVMRLFIDTVIPNKNMNEIVMWSGVLLVIVLIRILANFFQNYTLSIVEGNFERDLKITIFEKILKLPMAFFVKNDTGSLMSRVLTDSANSTGLFRDYYIVLYSSILSIAASLAAMFWLDWFLTLMCFLVLPVLFVVTVIMNSKMAIESQKLSGVYADCSKELNQSLSAPPSLSLSLEPFESSMATRVLERSLPLVL